MERKSGVLDTVVIGQDDQTELHVQAAIVGGRRQVDIRIWKRGPTGFAPTRSALTVEAVDLDALQEGITELLEASHGGEQVARVVWDKDEGRRLRAETEPFGTRHLARFGFWQRVRDTWRPADDGLVIGAEHLKRLQDILTRFRPKLHAPPAAGRTAEELERETLSRWPSAGADWLTAEGDRVAFHPRGIRIAGMIEDTDDAHRLVLRQWRREDSLWLPEDAELVLQVADVDWILATLRAMLDAGTEQQDGGAQIPCADSSKLWVRTRTLDGRQLLCIDLLQPPTENMALGYEQRLFMPLEYLPLFGRMLAQCAAALLSRLSEEERDNLRQHTELAEPVKLAEALAETSLGEVPATVNGANGNGATATDHDLAGDASLHEIFAQAHDDSEPAVPPPTPPQRAAPLSELKLGRHNVALRLNTGEQMLYVSWDERWIQISLTDLDQLLDHLRDLYYDALRGRRGRMITISDVAMSVHHHGFTMYIVLEQERGGRRFELSFPANEVSSFLDAASGALAKA